MDTISNEINKRKASMKDLKDAHLLWSIAAKKNWLDKTAKAEEFCKEVLYFCWGPNCTVDFNYSTLSMSCKDANGAVVDFNGE